MTKLNIKIHSKKVKDGDIFVVINDQLLNNEEYVEEAIASGAAMIVCSEGYYDVETLYVEDTMVYLKEYLKEHYSDKINEMKLIGVTGTNGKTTTCYLSYQLLNKLNYKTAYIGTLGLYHEQYIKPLNNTTPNIVELYELLLTCYELGYQCVVMEISSHALFYDRIYGFKLNTGLFTNLTQDHLDFHHTFNEYLESKMKIVNYVEGNMILNIDDPFYKYFDKDKISTFGFNESDFTILQYRYTLKNTFITLKYNNKSYTIKTKLKNRFNIYNLVGAIIITLQVVDDLTKVISCCNELEMAKGRCEIIQYKDNDIVVDYAHTPDAVEKVIQSFREITNNQIITIIGCGGDRDKLKRPIMADVACRNSDEVIFTSDNPRTEDPNEIINDMIDELSFDNYTIIINRKDAIRKGIALLNNEDTLLILGKGHENYQLIGSIKYHFDDVEIVKNIMEELN